MKNKGITARDKPKRVKNYLPHLWSQRTFTDGVLRYSKQKIGEIKEDSDEEGSDAPKKNLEVITFFNQANTKTNLSNKFRSLSSCNNIQANFSSPPDSRFPDEEQQEKN